MSEPLIRLECIARTFGQGRTSLKILRGINLHLRPGEIVGLIGPSGAGKSTLLHIAGLLEKPDDGDVFLSGEPCGRLSDEARTAQRREHIGFVYQYHHLLPEFSAMENVVIPQLIAGRPRKAAEEHARQRLSSLGLAERIGHRPGQLSGGEQQRVAIARALANDPRVLLADEPTGNLDPHTAGEVFDMLLRLVKTVGLAAIIATHNPGLASRMDRTVRLEDGVLVGG
ncbi:MAG: ABC transporter ATP-binding protein [Hyphomicrobiales bacterium]|nr:ABC transporter ATP-binding protein [Hyphomicrobiales bacterium]